MNEPTTESPAARALARRFIEHHPVDAARVLDRVGGKASAGILQQMSVTTLAEVVTAMTDDVAADCIADLDDALGAEVLAVLDLDECAALLRRMNNSRREKLLDAMPPDQSELTRRILAFPTGTAGSLMDPKVLWVRDSLTAGQALDHVRAAPHLALYYLYLVDGSSRLSGVVNLRELMLSAPDQPLSSVMITSVDRLSAAADHMAILAHPGWTEYHALPVVDHNGRFVGALRYETLRRLESQSRAEVSPASLAVSLGELYWLGLSGILQGLGNTAAAGSRGWAEEVPDDR